MAEQPKELVRTDGPQDAAALAGFERGAIALQTENVGAMSAIAREQSEIQAAVILARRFPRDEAAAYDNVMASCQRPAFAAKETCVWDFPRGGKKLSGPGVALAREMARHWGHIQYAIRIVSQDEHHVHIAGFAYDCQTNTRVTMEDSFEKLIYRRKGGWQKPDERDLRELINRRGAICVRNALLQILPPDLTEDAVEKVRDTRRSAARGDIAQGKQGWDQARRRLTVAFRAHGVTTEMLEKHLGHNMEDITADELVELRGIYGSLTDGNTKPQDHFGDANGDTQATDADIKAGLRKPRNDVAGLQTEEPPATESEAAMRLQAPLPGAAPGDLHPPEIPPKAEVPAQPATAPPAGNDERIGKASKTWGVIRRAYEALPEDAQLELQGELGFTNIDQAGQWTKAQAAHAIDRLAAKKAAQPAGGAT